MIRNLTLLNNMIKVLEHAQASSPILLLVSVPLTVDTQIRHNQGNVIAMVGKISRPTTASWSCGWTNC
jgi:hypothetical protein